jgi:hypothetical protein
MGGLGFVVFFGVIGLCLLIFPRRIQQLHTWINDRSPAYLGSYDRYFPKTPEYVVFLRVLGGFQLLIAAVIALITFTKQ